MKGYSTKAFVLGKKDFKEADQLVTLFTESQGKVRAIAKGIKKAKSRNVGNLEPLNLIEVMLVPGKNLEIITQVKIINSFSGLKENLNSISLVYYLVELLERTLSENEPVPDIFQLFKEFLTKIDQEKDPLHSFLLHSFELKLIRYLGFSPELFCCLSCGKKLISGKKKQFDFLLGGTICQDCYQDSDQRLEISDSVIKVLRLINQEGHLFLPAQFQIQQKDVQLSQRVIENYLLWILEKRLKSLEVIHAFQKVSNSSLR
jgi:DNA repair protein RecO (recombination protein O)